MEAAVRKRSQATVGLAFLIHRSMQSKISASRIRLRVLFIGCVFFAAFFFFFYLKNRMGSDLAPFPVDESVQKQISSGFPVRLKIPVINVDAAVEFVGLTPDGAMGAPKGGRNVGWFDSGPYPGENGSAVIDGHFGRWKNGEGSVFDDLNRLKKGDRLYVEDDKGITTTFVVRETRSFDPNADATDVFSSGSDGAHLNLITCEGVWNKDSKSYSQRLVIFADKE